MKHLKIVMCAMVLLCAFTGISQAQSKFKKTKFIALSADKIAKLKAVKLPAMLKITDTGLKTEGSFTMVYSSGTLLLVPDSKLQTDNEYQVYFASLGTGVKDGKIVYIYCSCGDNTSATRGDECYVKVEGTEARCVGSCAAGTENEGKTCGISTLAVDIGSTID